MGDREHMSIASWIYFHLVRFNKTLCPERRDLSRTCSKLTTSRNSLELSNAFRIYLANKNICFETFMTYRKSFFNLFLKYPFEINAPPEI